MDVGRIDVHAHFLPGVDDGCADIEDAILCGRSLVAAGYTHAFCTPHIWPGLPQNSIENIRRWTSELQRFFTTAGVPLTLMPGGEWNLKLSWPALKNMEPDQIISYGLAGRHILFDFWSDKLPRSLEPAIEFLHSIGMQPILAHPERISVFQRDPAALDAVIDMGVLLQMNTWCLTDPPEAPTRRMAEQLLKEDRYFCFGSDTHNSAGMPVRIVGLTIATEMVGPDRVDRLTRKNLLPLLSPFAG